MHSESCFATLRIARALSCSYDVSTATRSGGREKRWLDASPSPSSLSVAFVSLDFLRRLPLARSTSPEAMRCSTHSGTSPYTYPFSARAFSDAWTVNATEGRGAFGREEETSPPETRSRRSSSRSVSESNAPRSPYATVRNMRPCLQSDTSATFAYPNARIVDATGAPVTNACLGATSLSARSRGSSSSMVASPWRPPPTLPPTFTCRPKGKLLTTAATRASGSSKRSEAAARQSSGLRVIASATATVGVGVSIREGRRATDAGDSGVSSYRIASRSETRPSSSTDVSADASASSPKNATSYGVPASHSASDACTAGMARRKDARFPLAFRAFCAFMSPPSALYPRDHAACRMVPPPQHGSRIAPRPQGSPSPPAPTGANTAFTATAAMDGCVPAL